MAVKTVDTFVDSDLPVTDPNSGLQYHRKFQLIVEDPNFNGLDLSQLHCKFTVKQLGIQTPNCADIRVYNLSADTALAIKKQFTKVTIQGGYDSNFGVIFTGNIKQAIIGRESQTDTFLDLNCGDGDLAYNFAVVNQTIAAGSSQADQTTQVMNSMNALGVKLAPNQTQALKTFKLPRGKTLWGGSKDYLRTISKQNGQTWSIQNSLVAFVPQNAYAPGETVILTSKTGIIGTPQQTNYGVNVVCLMNPLIHPRRTIKIDNASVAQLRVDLGNPKDPVNLAPPLTADGVYYVLVVEQTGDNRGIDWYSKLICCTTNASAPYIGSVPTNYGP